MRNNLKPASGLHSTGALRGGHSESHDDADSIRTVAASLDRVRRITTEVGYATLLAEVGEAPSEELCVVLDELAASAELAFAQLRAIERAQARKPVPLAEIHPLRR
jgi:hypothetical protein